MMEEEKKRRKGRKREEKKVERKKEGKGEREKDSAFTPSYRKTYTRVGMVPQQNNEKPRSA